MRTLKIWPAVTVCVAAYAIPLLAQAQQAAGSAPASKLEKLEEGEAPAITIRKPEGERKVTEKRAPGGKVTEVKVTKGKNTYYLKPNDPAGSAVPGDAQSNTMRAAQWPVLEFDMKRSENAPAPEPAILPPAQK